MIEVFPEQVALIVIRNIEYLGMAVIVNAPYVFGYRIAFTFKNKYRYAMRLHIGQTGLFIKLLRFDKCRVGLNDEDFGRESIKGPFYGNSIDVRKRTETAHQL